MKTTENNLTYSIRELSYALGIGLKSAYSLAKDNPELHAVKIGKQYRVSKDAVKSWLHKAATA